MSADTLRQAAALMRERALASLRDGSEARDLWTAAPTIDPDNDGWVVHQQQQRDVDWDTTVARLEYDFQGSTARHMASWHPTVALAVAVWLTETADHIDTDDGTCSVCDHAALAVANAYLGGAA